MIGNIICKVFLAIALFCSVSCMSPEQTGQENEVTLKTTAEGVRHGFWKNPNLNYVAEAIPPGGPSLSIRDIPDLESSVIDTAPIDRKDGIAVGELGVDGGDKNMLVKLAAEVADSQHGSIDSLLVAHEGKLLFESYYLAGRANLAVPQASATKTYTALALGRAIQMGYLTQSDLDKPIISFLKDLDPSTFVEGAELVTLHQALTMRSGIRVSKEQRQEFSKQPDRVKGQGLVQTIFEQSAPITTETQRDFSYGNYSSSLVMQVIEAVVPGTAEDFIKDELLGKMGITAYSWRSGLGGLPAGGWRSVMSPRAMLKFGTLMMNQGKWNDEQLVPKWYVTKATSSILYTSSDVKVYGGGQDVSNQSYGYFLWSADLKVGNKTYPSTSAQGGGGQFIILIDALDLIVVVTAHEREVTTLQMVAEKILPAFVE